MWLKGWLPYEECYRVPMIVRWPGKTEAGSKTYPPGADTRSGAHLRRGGRSADACPLPTAPRYSRCSPIRGQPQWRDDILCAYYGGEFLYTQRIAITDRFKYVFNGFDYRRDVRSGARSR